MTALASPSEAALEPGPRPFLKWAGGKTQLLPAIRAQLPEALTRDGSSWRRGYFEPFMGSAAVFFALSPRLERNEVRLSDANPELVFAFVAVRDHVDGLIRALAEHDDEHNVRRAGCPEAQRDYYERVRARDRDPGWRQRATGSPERVIEHAARFIYLNKTCFNGLWRVNRQGHYNVPMGRYRRPGILNEAALRAAHRALQGVGLSSQSYGEAVAQAQAGDLVYFDPPYMPLSSTSSFNAYAKDAFLQEEHVELALVYLALAARGVRVLLSNSATAFTRLPLGPKDDSASFRAAVEPVLGRRAPGVLAGASVDTLFEAYGRCWNVVDVSARRAINSRASSRGAVTEILVTSHRP